MDKSKLIINASRLFLVVFFTAIFVKFAYENGCYVFSCAPASWEKILDMAIAHSGSDFRISYISVRPSFWNYYTELGPTFIDVSVDYISLGIDDSRKDEDTNHPTKTLIFDDRNLITRIRTGGSWTNYVPPEDSQEKLKRVTVHPRDAFRLTWMLAEKDSSIPSKNANVSANVGLYGLTKDFGCESTWAVFYYYDHFMLKYYINAQTGQIISSEKNSY